MPWLRFADLSPAQAIVAQQQLDAHVDPPFLKRTKLREFWIVDGDVKGSRLIRTERDNRIMNTLLGPRDVASKGSLHGWTGGPEKWSLDP